MTELVGHFAIFAVIGVVLLALPMIIGWFFRPRLPTPEKDAIYECGEPTIGSSYIQFDLRFYVVALLFIIFDVEVVFFFPWASVFGTVMQLTDTSLSEATRQALSARLLGPGTVIDAASALKLGWLGLADVLVFFAVLLVGFAYVWKRGDLDWVRAVAQKAKQASARS